MCAHWDVHNGFLNSQDVADVVASIKVKMSLTGQQEYDVIVVGAGMIGSAAAKYLKYCEPSWKILLIGPTEPKVRYWSIIEIHLEN